MPVMRCNCLSEKAGWMRSLNEASSLRASSSVEAMKGLMPGRIFTWAGLRPVAATRRLISE
ncbi:hypothetical protein D3C72_1717900 [compost metagenome]